MPNAKPSVNANAMPVEFLCRRVVTIGESDPVIVTKVIERCEDDAEAREYFVRRAAGRA